jgi:S-adenosylmethionine synthetase
VAVSYAIGVAEPTSINVETFGTGKVDDVTLTRAIREHFDLRPKGIIEMLDLLRPIYLPVAAYGHFGRDDAHVPWEKTDKADDLKNSLGAAAA